MDQITLSDATSHLEGTAKARYLEKCEILGLGDPYLLPQGMFIKLTDETVILPPVEFGDVYIYLIEKASAYSKQALKAYKSLEAYRNFIDGWPG